MFIYKFNNKKSKMFLSFLANMSLPNNECDLCGCGVCSFCKPKMEKHKEMFKLIYDFRENRINKTKNNLISKYNSIKNSLAKFFDNLDFLPSDCNNLEDCENSLEKMELKINEINSHINDLDKGNKKYELLKNEEEKLLSENEERINKIKNSFDKKKQKYIYKDYDKEKQKINIKKNKIEI